MDEDFDAIERDADDILDVVDHAREDLSAIGPPGQFAPAETLGPEPGFIEQAQDFFIDKLVPEVGDMLGRQWDMGASEFAKFLYGQADGFVLYGPALEPIEPIEIESPEESFDDILREASKRSAPDREQEFER